MFIALRKSTVIFLAILQLIAPLVHAHAGENVLNLGLHVPGLEMYSVEHAVPATQVVSYDSNSGRTDSESIATLAPSLEVEGIIVGVGAGMKDKQVITDLDDVHYLHQHALVFDAVISPFDTTIPQQSQQFACRLFIPSLSPRAPPAQ